MGVWATGAWAVGVWAGDTQETPPSVGNVPRNNQLNRNRNRLRNRVSMHQQLIWQVILEYLNFKTK